MTAPEIAISILLSAAAAGQATPVRSDQPASSPSAFEPSPIVVTGRKATQDAIDEFVGRITLNTEGRIATFEQPICPAAFGLPAAYNHVLEQRLRGDAAEVGLRTAAEQCDANIVLIVSDNPSSLISMLERVRPQMFAGLERSQVDDILKEKQAVRTWQAIEPRGTDGRPLQRVTFLQWDAGPPIPIGGQGTWFNPWAANSRIQQSIRPDLVSSFVVIQTDAVDGLTLTQIADYAAMRALARTRYSAGVEGQSVLGVVDGSDGDRGIQHLTSWDLAYLRSLYRTSNIVAAHQQKADIAATMQKQLRKLPLK
jgi:hypothetical protein